MSGKQNKVALLVHSCDRYEFLYRGFAYFFAKHWDRDIPCNCYFATEEKDVDIAGFRNIKSGTGEWSDRLRHLLTEKIEEDYVLYFQEDMWLNKDVNAAFFSQLFDMAAQNDWDMVKLHSSEVYRTVPEPHFIEGFNLARLDNAASGFLMSHQVTLWKRTFLAGQLPKNEHPWRNERRGTKRLKKQNPAIFHADYFAENGKAEINRNRNPIGRSEYQTISVNGVLNGNVTPFIAQLMQSGEAERNYAVELQYHFDNNMTHDGKLKPRKEAPLQRFKKWLKRAF